MTEIKEQDKKAGTLTLGGSKLTLSGVSKDRLAQGFPSARKGVQVEVKKKRRPFLSGQSASEGDDIHASQRADAGGLTAEERENRLRVLVRAAEDEKQREEEEKLLKDKSPEQAVSEKVEEVVEAPAPAAVEEVPQLTAQQREEEEKRALERRKAEEFSAIRSGVVIKKEIPVIHGPRKPAREKEVPQEEADAKTVTPIKANERVITKEAPKSVSAREEEEAARLNKAARSEPRRRSHKLTVTEALSEREERVRSLASVRRQRAKARRHEEQPKDKVMRDVVIPETISVQELANRMTERVVDVVKVLMKMGMIVTAGQTLDADTAELVVAEFGHRSKRVADSDVETQLDLDRADEEEALQARPPVVTFMGHVDHGKTSLLDYLRNTHVVSGEAGGITQHIGAYQIHTDEGETITFLDTPGHEAFTEMRKRGATATDIVVLVVAADDGIMAQTVEAINHAKAAGVPIIVAINKMDKESANPLAVKNALLEHHLVAEDFGGEVMAVEVSAKTGANMDKLLEAILLQAEVMELKANPDRPAMGVVVESKIDKARGVVATILVQKGTLNVGDILVAGEAYGKVRLMNDANGRRVERALPSQPVEVLGLDQAPEAGSVAAVAATEKVARDVVEYRMRLARDLKVLHEKRSTLDELFRQASEGGIKELPLVIKGDVQGSVEAISASLQKISTDEVAVRLLHTGVGGITTSDISLASASRAIVLGFNVRAETTAKEVASAEGVDIRYYSIIYDLIDDIRALLGGMLKPEIREEYIGTAEIREIFNMSKYGKIAGCYVTQGMVKRGAGVRLLRDNVVVHEGKLKTLRRFKDDVKEVSSNFECGMAFENYEDIKVGDVIEAFELVEHKRTL